MSRFTHPVLGTWTVGVRRGFGVAKRPSGKPDNRYATVVMLEAPAVGEADEQPARWFGTTFWKACEDQFCRRIARGIAFKRALEEMAASGMPESEFFQLKGWLRQCFRKIQSGKRIRHPEGGGPVTSPPSGAQASVHVN